jgi:hypothetical protein
MTKRKYPVRGSAQEDNPVSLDGVVDMELNCLACGTRLYVPEALIDAVLASLGRDGAAMLVCAECNHVQLVSWMAPRGRGLDA